MANSNDGTKNLLKQFQRNNYFYGKLMTVRDFENEQAYFNEKRHLLNTTLNGYGIVCGFTDIEVEEKAGNLSLKFNDGGFAIDKCGREIVVPSGSVKIVEKPQTNTFYIYIQRKDCPAEMVAAASIASGCEEKCCPNRIVEDFEISLSTTEPSAELIECKDIKEGSHLEKYPQVGAEGIFIGSIKKQGDEWAFYIEEESRTYIPNTKLLARRLECHITDQTNPHKLKHSQLLEILGIDSSEEKNKCDKHVSNADAKKWNSAVYTINGIKPDEGNFTIEKGDNIFIEKKKYGIKISTSFQDTYKEENISLKPKEIKEIEYKFERFPLIDIYERKKEYHFFDHGELEKISKEFGFKPSEIKKKSIDIRDFSRKLKISTTGLTTFKSFFDKVSPRYNISFSKNLKNKLNNNFSDIADNTLVFGFEYWQKILGKNASQDIEINIYPNKKMRIKIKNNNPERAYDLKIILRA